jgi:hypothetical protein
MVHLSSSPEAAPAFGRIAVVVKGYPRLSETFIAQELLALEQRGLVLDIFSLRHPTDPDIHPVHRRIAARATYLPEYLHQEPGRVLRAWRAARYLAGYAEARRVWLRDLRRDRSRNRVRRFGQACVLATELPAGTTRFYAHFLHTPASVARYAALMRRLPWWFWSITGSISAACHRRRDHGRRATAATQTTRSLFSRSAAPCRRRAPETCCRRSAACRPGCTGGCCTSAAGGSPINSRPRRSP